MRDEMKVGDGVLFYHSSSKPLSVVGTATVVREAYPDHTAWDPADQHHDPKSTPANPIWFMVEIRAERQFARPVTLEEMKGNPRLRNMMLLRRGMRLSIQPVTREEWDEIVSLGSRP
jgi:predicted RNA-binding protein with PUA-like domain